jgi:predicted DCC family thiol-disulfide oxidoreductase YuxK
LYDGVCSFCDYFINFVHKRDTENVFSFCRLQSDTGRELLKKYRQPFLKTVIYIEEDTDKCYSHSTAVLRILSYLNVPWNLAYTFIVVPKFVRDFCYSTFASYRYTLFGKKDDGACPYNPTIRKKCIDWGEPCDIDAEEEDESSPYSPQKEV